MALWADTAAAHEYTARWRHQGGQAGVVRQGRLHGIGCRIQGAGWVGDGVSVQVAAGVEVRQVAGGTSLTTSPLCAVHILLCSPRVAKWHM